MKLKLQVTPTEGETYVVETNLFTIIQMERKFKVRASDLATGIALEQLAFLAFEAAKQNGITVPAVFDDYLRRVEMVEVISQDDGNPTNGGHSAEA